MEVQSGYTQGFNSQTDTQEPAKAGFLPNSNEDRGETQNNNGSWSPPTTGAEEASYNSNPMGFANLKEQHIPESFKEMLKAQFVKYGDKVKLCTKSKYTKDRRAKGFISEGNSYIGVYEKQDGTARLAIPPIDEKSKGKFMESTFEITSVDESKAKKGDFVKYGDVLVLVDQSGLVWNNKSGAFFDGYIGMKNRGVAGEMYVSFKKNGREGKELLYADPGVYIDVVESHRNRTAFNNRLSNYRKSNSKCLGGYICSDGSGTILAFSIHPASGMPAMAYEIAKKESLKSKDLTQLISISPEVESVKIKRKLHGKDDMDDAIIDPAYDSVFKLYDVDKNDEIMITLYDGCAGKVRVESLLEHRETIVNLSPPNPGFQKAAKYERNSTKRITTNNDLLALQVMVEQGAPSKERGEEDEETQSGGHLGILLSFDKLAVLYLLIAFGLPYILWNLMVYIDMHQLYITNSVEGLFGLRLSGMVQTFISRLLEHFAGGSGKAHACGISEASGTSSMALAVFLCWFSGYATPSFIRGKQTEGIKVDPHRENLQLLMTIALTAECFKVEKTKEAAEFIHEIEEPPEEIEEKKEISQEKVTKRSPWFIAGVDENGVPKHEEFERFLVGEKGNMETALRRWYDTIEWREDLGVDDILEQPHTNFDIIKTYYPHYFCGMTKDNHQLYIERNVQVDLNALKENGLTQEDLLWHYVYTSEYTTKILHKKTECTDGKSVTILDVQGIRFRDFAGEVVRYIKNASHIAQERYPERSYKIYILFVPIWFDLIFRVVKPMIDETTLKKFRIYRSGFEKELLEEIDADVLPVKYGGNFDKGDYKTPQEIELRKFVMSKIQKAGAKMKPVK